MTFDQARDALVEAGKQDMADDTAENFQPRAAATEQADVPASGDDSPDEGASELASADVAEDSLWAGEDINPDLLPDELKPLAKQFEAAYTRKTQTLAEQRKELEALGSAEELKQAADFYKSLQDPEYLRDFYGELGNVVKELGLIEEPAAPEDVAPPAPPELSPEMARIAETDPELAPFLQEFNAMKSRLDSFEASQTEREQAMEQERLMMSQAQEIDRMVQVVREEHPEYTDDDWSAIYDRAVAFDGDVLTAAEKFQSDRDRIIQDYLSRKESPAAVQPSQGAGTVTEDEEQPMETLDDAEKAGLAFLEANDLMDWSG
jgi:hypothetical protein